jgi:hypothetical protein
VARPVHGITAKQHQTCIGQRQNRNPVARTEDQQPPCPEAVAGNVDLARHDIDGALLVVGIKRHDCSRRQHRLGIERRPWEADRRGLAIGRTHDQPRAQAIVANDRKVFHAVMNEGRWLFLVCPGQGRPRLDAEQARTSCPDLRRRALGMGDAAPGRHQVEFARPDRQFGAQRIAVHDFAVEQEGHGRQPDMRMGPHIEPLPEQELGWPHLVKEDERPDHLAAHRWQGAPDLEPAKVAGTRHDHLFDRSAGMDVAGRRIIRRLVGHGRSSSTPWLESPTQQLAPQGAPQARPSGCASIRLTKPKGLRTR